MDDQKQYFIQAIQPYGSIILGTVLESYYNKWARNEGKLVMFNPRALNIQPAKSNQGFNIAIVPVFVVKSPQSIVSFDASAVEVLGEVKGDEIGEYLEPINSQCGDVKNIFQAYKDSVNQWKYELTGLQIPTGPIQTSGGTDFLKGDK